MGENSGIQWTTHTFNPWVGCQRVSPGCTNCYAETYDKRVGGVPVKQRKDPKVAELRWGPKAPRPRTSAANWRKPLQWNAEAAEAKRRDRVFCASLADVFEDREELVPWRRDLFGLIAATPHLDWLLLTKRPENIARLWPLYMFPPGSVPMVSEAQDCPKPSEVLWPNVWLGTTVEDQQRANERIPALLSVPARVRFLSMEPLLEAVDLTPLWQSCSRCGGSMSLPVPGGGRSCPACLDHQGVENAGVHWAIIGGESGGNARRFEVAWARDLVRQCRIAGVAPFVKQFGSHCTDGKVRVGNGEYHPLRVELADHHGGDMAEWPTDLRVREFPR